MFEAIVGRSNSSIPSDWMNDWQELNFIQENIYQIFNVLNVPASVGTFANISHWTSVVEQFQNGSMDAAFKL